MWHTCPKTQGVPRGTPKKERSLSMKRSYHPQTAFPPLPLRTYNWRPSVQGHLRRLRRRLFVRRYHRDRAA